MEKALKEAWATIPVVFENLVKSIKKRVQAYINAKWLAYKVLNRRIGNPRVRFEAIIL